MSRASTGERGSWVPAHLGVELADTADDTADGPAGSGPHRVGDLVELALRRNPKRAHLLVSTVLGKHIPADPEAVHASAAELGARVRRVLDGHPSLVLGFAETATGLGHAVAETLSAPYLSSTRRSVPGARSFAGFEEEHSHASSHQLLPDDPTLFAIDAVLVLVDDELSTGRTARNTIEALHRAAPRDRYVLAALVDLRTTADRAVLEEFAVRLGIEVQVVALAAGLVTLPDTLTARVAELIAQRDAEAPTPTAPAPPADVVVHDVDWPDSVPESGRHGITAAQTAAMGPAAARVAATLAPTLAGPDVLVLGTEELMYAPTLIARELAHLAETARVRVSSSTRSPVLAVDEPGYPIRSALTFPSHDPCVDGPGGRHAYNVAGAGFSDIVVVVDSDTDEPALHAGLVERLRGECARVHVVTLPCRRPLPEPLSGPDFGSYPADDVAWLLTDLSAVELEAPTEEREEAIQAGGAHYAESLPVEYQPDARYTSLFTAALEQSASRVAHAIGVVTELVLAERGEAAVLVSLARAGTPVGVLMRRWARFAHGLDLTHYAVSIVRGRGIDEVALRHLSRHHDPPGVVFVDGWTGKGAITRELGAAVEQANLTLGTAFDADLAVLADPGSCVTTFGTREDFLVPSACLNSTVSGLVSRTVLNRDVLRPDQFHGAKFYRELAAQDVSGLFLDTVAARFPDVAADVARDWPVRQAEPRTPSWTGWAEVERISAEYGIGDVTLVKPGVGETTRVLLRRVPWAVLVRSADDPELAHVLLLAEQRGVPVREVPGLTYRAVGLIHPRYTRGASGADGRAAAPPAPEQPA